MIVVNSSPVILLAKQGMLELLKKCFNKAVIPKSVYSEVMQKNGSPEAIALRNAIEKGWILVEKTATMPALDTKSIGQAEKEAISLAYKHKSLLLIDDDSAKKYASIFNVEAHGTLYAIFLSYAKGFIKKNDAVNAFQEMIADGFYVSSELYSKFFELLNSMKRG